MLKNRTVEILHWRNLSNINKLQNGLPRLLLFLPKKLFYVFNFSNIIQPVKLYLKYNERKRLVKALANYKQKNLRIRLFGS